MARHYSKVLIEIPDSESDPDELIVTIDCDVCGKNEWRTHINHFGTLARTLHAMFKEMQPDDDGVTHALKNVPPEKALALEYLDRRFPDWKADRLRERHGH